MLAQKAAQRRTPFASTMLNGSMAGPSVDGAKSMSIQHTFGISFVMAAGILAVLSTLLG